MHAKDVKNYIRQCVSYIQNNINFQVKMKHLNKLKLGY